MQTNFLIIGSGISGLNFALHAAKKGKVLLVTKKKIIDSNTNFAQGGIAAVLSRTDNAKELINDTLKAGSFHNKKSAVKFMVHNSTAAVHRLIDLGVEFEKENGKLKLTREGGHGKRRIAYVGDYTGKEIERILVKRVKEHPNITILENTFALKLITKGKTCYGCQVITKKVENIFADQTILATGGIGQLFLHTTNAKISTGDGIAMAIEAGCKVKDLEFIQFHPTAFKKNIFPKFLISEAVRGEGAKLLNSKGERFIDELLPRDKVARAIYKEGPVFLDISHKSAKELKKRFPRIYETLEKHGYKMEKDLIPVTPAVHYLCGGIVTDLKGRTNIKNLFAFGEVACTGVHGANRLASNSLLEALVFSNQIAKELRKQKTPKLKINKTKLSTKKISKKEIQKLMWHYAGITRDPKLVKEEAIPKLTRILNEIKGSNKDLQEAKNMAIVGLEILKAILKRKKSLGCHFLKKL